MPGFRPGESNFERMPRPRKLGIESSYCMVNVLLYSVYGQPSAAERQPLETDIAAYRTRWPDALLAHGEVKTVVAFGGRQGRRLRHGSTCGAG